MLKAKKFKTVGGGFIWLLVKTLPDGRQLYRSEEFSARDLELSRGAVAHELRRLRAEFKEAINHVIALAKDDVPKFI